jgi:hypothetical protein
LASFFHYIAFAANVQTTEGLLIDFVGQGKSFANTRILTELARPASMMQVLVIDASISGLQLLCLTVSYLSSHPHSRTASLFSYPDPLLPPLNLTSGHASKIRLRRTEEGHAQRLLDDDEYTTETGKKAWSSLAEQIDASSSPTGRAPVILNLSLFHLCRLVLFYPSPVQPEQSAAPTLTRAHPTVSNDARQAPSQGERVPGQWISQAS